MSIPSTIVVPMAVKVDVEMGERMKRLDESRQFIHWQMIPVHGVQAV